MDNVKPFKSGYAIARLETTEKFSVVNIKDARLKMAFRVCPVYFDTRQQATAWLGILNTKKTTTRYRPTNIGARTW